MINFILYYSFITVKQEISQNCYYRQMDFRDRLRERIEYLGMLDKEVAAKAGISKRAIDSYVGSRKCMPSADVAVRLAKVLGVSVEYLITGENYFPNEQKSATSENHEVSSKINALVDDFIKLSEREQDIVLTLTDKMAETTA